MRKQEQVWRRGEPTENDLKFQRQINKLPWEAKLKGNGEKSSGVLAIPSRNGLRAVGPERCGGRDKCE